MSVKAKKKESETEKTERKEKTAGKQGHKTSYSGV